MRVRFILCLLAFLICKKSWSQDSIKRYRFQILPSIFHTPETSWGFGVTTLGYFTPKDTNTRKSNAQLFLDYTLNHQISFQSDFALFSKKNKYYFNGSHDLSKFPEFYFGIGNENRPTDAVLIKISYADLKLNALKKLKPNLYAGPSFHHQSLYDTDHKIVHNGIEINNMGYSSTGLGLTFMIDKRDNLLCPEDGYFFQNSTIKYFDHSHQTAGFVMNNFDARYYKTLKQQIVFNAALYSVNGKGYIPFRMMPFLGGARYMRGYYAGRFRDNNMSIVQAEFRKHLFWRIGIASFGGFGQVYENVREFSFNRFHYNYGVGLRFQISEDSRANIRVDLGKTRDSHGLYVVFAEAF